MRALNPTRPQKAAGTRTEPEVSVPTARSTIPAATATAEPEEEPPGIRSGASGLTGLPKCGFSPSPEKANSLWFVLPTHTVCFARFRTMGASSVATGAFRRDAEPLVLRVPATSKRSFQATRGPSPCARAGVTVMNAVDSAARRSASSTRSDTGHRLGRGQLEEVRSGVVTGDVEVQVGAVEQAEVDVGLQH